MERGRSSILPALCNQEEEEEEEEEEVEEVERGMSSILPTLD